MTRIQRRPDRYGAFASLCRVVKGDVGKKQPCEPEVDLAVLDLHCDVRCHTKLLRHVKVSSTEDLFLPPLTGIREPWRR